jgi:hypothetical protein
VNESDDLLTAGSAELDGADSGFKVRAGDNLHIYEYFKTRIKEKP